MMVLNDSKRSFSIKTSMFFSISELIICEIASKQGEYSASIDDFMCLMNILTVSKSEQMNEMNSSLERTIISFIVIRHSCMIGDSKVLNNALEAMNKDFLTSKENEF